MWNGVDNNEFQGLVNSWSKETKLKTNDEMFRAIYGLP